MNATVDSKKFVIRKVEVEVKIPKQDWIDFIIDNCDIFGRDYCGYWARGAKFSKKRGWLVWEHGDDFAPYGQEPNRKEALKAWRHGAPLPKDWHCLGLEAVIKAYLEACRRWGVEWMDGDHGDANGYDVVIQTVLLGEVRYG